MDTPHRGAGFDIVPERPTGAAPPRSMSYPGSPGRRAISLVLPARGRPPACTSAWSQPTQSTHERAAPMARRWKHWDALAWIARKAIVLETSVRDVVMPP